MSDPDEDFKGLHAWEREPGPAGMEPEFELMRQEWERKTKRWEAARQRREESMNATTSDESETDGVEESGQPF